MERAEAVELETLIIERALYHINTSTTSLFGMTVPWPETAPEHVAVEYAARELVNLAKRHGMEVGPIDVELIAKRLAAIRAKEAGSTVQVAKRRI